MERWEREPPDSRSRFIGSSDCLGKMLTTRDRRRRAFLMKITTICALLGVVFTPKDISVPELNVFPLVGQALAAEASAE